MVDVCDRTDLNDEQKVNRWLVSPLHPDRPDVQLRAVLTKRGYFAYYEPTSDRPGTENWRPFRDCTDDETIALLALDQDARLAHRRGPAGCIMIDLESA